MEKEVGDGSFRQTGAGSAHGDDEPVLRPYRQRVQPQSATVNRASIVIDECTELSLPQKRRTQFLSSNYVGEIAVMPGAWSLPGSNENAAGDVLMYLADPKPDVEKTTTSDSAEKNEKNRTENKLGAFDKEVDNSDANRFGDDEKGVSQIRHK